jgi:hypothetical protein
VAVVSDQPARDGDQRGTYARRLIYTRTGRHPLTGSAGTARISIDRILIPIFEYLMKFGAALECLSEPPGAWSSPTGACCNRM